MNSLVAAAELIADAIKQITQDPHSDEPVVVVSNPQQVNETQTTFLVTIDSEPFEVLVTELRR